MRVTHDMISEKAPLLQHQQQAGDVAGGVPAIEIMLVVESTDIRTRDPFVGSENRAHTAIEPNYGFLRRRPFGRGRRMPGRHDLRQAGTVARGEIENLAAAADETVAKRHGFRGW